MKISSWKEELRTSRAETANLLNEIVPQSDYSGPRTTLPEHFPLKATKSYLDRIDKADPQDPLLLQILPTHAEQIETDSFSSDPVGDLDAQVVPGLLHKYHGRVLLVTTGACAIHCRYCFRQHFPYDENNLGSQECADALSYIQQDDSISEVILSGGDPLMLSDQKLGDLISQLDNISHLKRLRIHSRMPAVLPSRVNIDFLDIMRASRLNSVMVVHINHANEIDENVMTSLRAMKAADITVLNQSVLLKGINDNSEVLAALSDKLFEAGVLPYYLHMLDAVQGAAHFQVNDKDARSLMHTLNSLLPGYLVPKLVKEQSGATYKLPIL